MDSKIDGMTREELDELARKEIAKLNGGTRVEPIIEETPPNVVEMKKIRWMLIITLHDAGQRAKFPFTTKAAAFTAAQTFDPKYSKVERLDREPDLLTQQQWAPYLDLSPDEIINRCEEIRSDARKSKQN